MRHLSSCACKVIFLLVIVGVLFSGFVSGQETKQTASTNDALLTLDGDVASPLKLSTADFARLPRRSVKATDHDGKSATFEGVALVEVLKLGGVEFGEKLRGKKLASCLLVEAADGYRVVFALPELDPAFTDKVILLADRRDGQPLSEKEGKLRIVVPDEKRQARWVRQVISLTLRNL